MKQKIWPRKLHRSPPSFQPATGFFLLKFILFQKGTTTFSIKTLTIIGLFATLSINDFSINDFSINDFSIMTFSIMTFSIMTLLILNVTIT
jgi:hypothetical protein